MDVPDKIPVGQLSIFIRVSAHIVEAGGNRIAWSFQNTPYDFCNIETALKVDDRLLGDGHLPFFTHFPCVTDWLPSLGIISMETSHL